MRIDKFDCIGYAKTKDWHMYKMEGVLIKGMTRKKKFFYYVKPCKKPALHVPVLLDENQKIIQDKRYAALIAKSLTEYIVGRVVH